MTVLTHVIQIFFSSEDFNFSSLLLVLWARICQQKEPFQLPLILLEESSLTLSVHGLSQQYAVVHSLGIREFASPMSTSWFLNSWVQCKWCRALQNTWWKKGLSRWLWCKMYSVERNTSVISVYFGSESKWDVGYLEIPMTSEVLNALTSRILLYQDREA